MGHDIRVIFTVGDVPKQEKKASRPAPAPQPKAEVTATPIETPPWEEPPAPPADALEELMAKGKTLESFKIK